MLRAYRGTQGRRTAPSWIKSALALALCSGAAIRGAAQSAPDGYTPGTSLASGLGVTESVATIMAREAALGPHTNGPARELKPRLVRNASTLPQNPGSPATSHWPASKASATKQTTTQGGMFTPQVVATSFLGAQISDTVGYVPPDSMADVGPSQIVVCVNGRIRSFNKDGSRDGALDATTDAFFGSVLGGSSTSDPRVRFDRLSGRWFITMITVNTPNYVLIAVSSGPTISSTSSFTFFSFQADPTNFGDYDTLGVDANALYIGVNVFRGNTFVNTTGFVVNKTNLMNGTLTVTTFANLISTGRHGRLLAGPYTPHGVNNDDPATTEGYFIGVDNQTAGTLTIRRITSPGGTPAISGNIFVTVPTTGNPLGGVPALGSTSGLDDLDDRLFATRMHNGSLWTAHNIEVDANGNASSAGGRDGSRWYQLNNMTGTPTLVQSGTLFDSAASNPRNFWIPSCAMSGQGHMALGSSVAGNNERADIAVAGRFASDAPGTLQAPTTAVTSSSSYNVNTGGSVYRWGDFSVTTVDPEDDMTMWTVQEYCNANNSWGVQVIKLLAPPPAIPTSCSPATVTQGVANVSVTIQGISANGRGFFDPGAGFPNHISTSVDGGGVTVSSVAYTDPMTLTAVLSVAGGAVLGARTITVTNPDGQAAVSVSGILTIAATGPVNQAPTLAVIPNQALAVGMTLMVTNQASDPDGDQLTFSLGPGAAANAYIDPTNGMFTWTPTGAQLGSNNFTVVVTDSGSPALSASQNFGVMVLPSNSPPALAVISNQTIAVGMTLVVPNQASDPDGDELSYSLGAGAALGAYVNSASGLFTWGPTGAQVGSNSFTVVVTDSGFPPLSASQSFAVMVLPSNNPPVLAAISNRTIHAGWTLVITNSATDPDVPPQVLTFSLDPGAPSTAVINPTNGVFSWTPDGTYINTTNTVTVQVTDNGLPPLSAAESFLVAVKPPPTIETILVTNDTVTIAWDAIAGQAYRVQYKTNVDDSVWSDLAPDLTAGGPAASATDAPGLESQRFYRVMVLP